MMTSQRIGARDAGTLRLSQDATPRTSAPAASTYPYVAGAGRLAAYCCDPAPIANPHNTRRKTRLPALNAAQAPSSANFAGRKPGLAER
jgi:hypothetical protein